MDFAPEQLEQFGLDRFIRANRLRLCEKTLSPNKVAAFLRFDSDQIAKVNAPPDDFSKNEKLYELIQKTAKVRDFLEALIETGNEHILEFIKEADLSAPSSSCSSSANPNPNPNRSQSQSRRIWFNIPEPIDSFCGREDFLTQLHDKLQSRDQDGSETPLEVTVLSQVKIVSGLGGIGKTETARRYVTKYQKFYNNFIWIGAESENSMRNSFLELAEEIKIPVKNAEGQVREMEKIVKDIYKKICEGRTSTLIIFDNAEDYQSCKKFFPFGLHPDLKKPVILATSRNQDWLSPTGTGKIQVLPLDVLTENESLEFIWKELEIPESDTEEFREESKEFIQLIGGLPLALQQAVAYIKQEKVLTKFLGKSYEIGDYVLEFKLSMKKFLSFSPVPPPDSSPTVFVTWNVTFAKIQKLVHGEEAIKILELMSFLFADKIPSSFLRDLVSEMGDGEFCAALKLLEKYSMIKMTTPKKEKEGSNSLSIHRQLQFVILQSLKESESESESNELSKVMNNLLLKCEDVCKRLKISQSADIFLSFSQIVKNPFDMIPVPETEEFLFFMHEFGEALWEASRFAESLAVYEEVYPRRRELLGERHHSTLVSQSQMGLLLLELGKYEESIAVFEDQLKKDTCSSSRLNTMYNIALALQHQQKYQESGELLQYVVDQRAKINGENSPETLEAQHAVASVHLAQGNFSRALALYEAVEGKRIQALGSEHRDVLLTKHNKANVLFKMKEYKEASKIYNEIYEKQKEMLGEDHAETIHTLYGIALSLEQEGKLPQALNIYKQVYEKKKVHYGESHPYTIIAQNAIVNVQSQFCATAWFFLNHDVS